MSTAPTAAISSTTKTRPVRSPTSSLDPNDAFPHTPVIPAVQPGRLAASLLRPVRRWRERRELQLSGRRRRIRPTHEVYLNDGGYEFDEFIPTATPTAPPAIVDETHVTVPSVSHQTVQGATDTLAAAHLTVGTVQQQASSQVPAGQVISQTPSAACIADRATTKSRAAGGAGRKHRQPHGCKDGNRKRDGEVDSCRDCLRLDVHLPLPENDHRHARGDGDERLGLHRMVRCMHGHASVPGCDEPAAHRARGVQADGVHRPERQGRFARRGAGGAQIRRVRHRRGDQEVVEHGEGRIRDLGESGGRHQTRLGSGRSRRREQRVVGPAIRRAAGCRSCPRGRRHERGADAHDHALDLGVDLVRRRRRRRSAPRCRPRRRPSRRGRLARAREQPVAIGYPAASTWIVFDMRSSRSSFGSEMPVSGADNVLAISDPEFPRATPQPLCFRVMAIATGASTASSSTARSPEPASGETRELREPATGEPLATVASPARPTSTAPSPPPAPRSTGRGAGRRRTSARACSTPSPTRSSRTARSSRSSSRATSARRSRSVKAELARRVENFRFFASVARLDLGPLASRSAARCCSTRCKRAGRRLRADRAVELPGDHDDLEALARAGRRLHGRAEARSADAADGVSGSPSSRPRSASRRARSTSSRRTARRPARTS